MNGAKALRSLRIGDYIVDVCTEPLRPRQPRGLLHLKIRRSDGEPIHCWRDLQAIKNQVVGPECEAVELYPAESRLVDWGHQYHLFCSTDPGWRFPFGLQHRFVKGETPARALVATFEAPELPGNGPNFPRA